MHVLTSSQIRQSFLDFFRSKQHTIVPSSSLMPDSPNLLFTNAGMNQFVPIFLGERKADVSRWAGAVPSLDTRAADTQKCIRAGGKHNDLDDVGLDTYHHTFFEMLGNWSFGDYFKKDAIAWAWELVIEVWKFPPQRIYATIYQPDKSKNDPADRDQEAWELWAEKFRSVGLDPDIHIVNGGKKDNFWMMGETGPCGPCTEIHVDLRPGPRETAVEEQRAGAKLVNGSDARCIEIWNNVFIQYNANPDGTFTPLPAQHVDTGMGFERVTSIIQGTKGLTDFQNSKISNYETDIFRPIFDEIEKLSGQRYGSTLPKAGSTGDTEQEKADVAFRVIADHIRTLSFAIADGISPGNSDRNYVLRRILRRAVRYGRTLGFHEPFFYKLVDVLARTMGDVFPEIRTRQQHVKEVLKLEEEAFNRTLDDGTSIFIQVAEKRRKATELARALAPLVPEFRSDWNNAADAKPVRHRAAQKFLASLSRLRPEIDSFLGQTSAAMTAVRESKTRNKAGALLNSEDHFATDVQALRSNLHLLNDAELSDEIFCNLEREFPELLSSLEGDINEELKVSSEFPGNAAFVLYDTYGFPLDLTELMARERGLTVDKAGFDALMEKQKAQARAAQKKQVIELSQIETKASTKFVGYDALETSATVLEVVELKDKTAVILDASACYAEMGGQLGDTGELSGSGQLWRIENTQKSGNVWLHFLNTENLKLETPPVVGSTVTLSVHADRRNAIQRHHTVTHLLHWALHEVVSHEASQKGSFVGPDKLAFDFNCAPLTPGQVADIEKLVNERIVENAGVSWTDVPHVEVKGRKDVMQFFGDKYGDVVRVVQVGGHASKLDGYSMELCGGTHTRATGEIGLFRIVAESAIAAGVRRIEAVAGLTAFEAMRHDRDVIRSLAGKVNSPVAELEKKVEALLAHQKELEKHLKAAAQREAAGTAKSLAGRAETLNGIPAIVANVAGADGDTLQSIADALKGSFEGVIVLGSVAPVGGAVALLAAVSPGYTAKVQAGKIIQAIAPIVGGKGGGKPDNARGGGKDASKLDEALAKARALVG